MERGREIDERQEEDFEYQGDDMDEVMEDFELDTPLSPYEERFEQLKIEAQEAETSPKEEETLNEVEKSAKDDIESV